MEKKLAEFRARRQAESADRKSQHVGGEQTTTTTAAAATTTTAAAAAEDTNVPSDTSSTDDCPQHLKRTEHDPTQSSQSRDYRDRLQDCALARWLNSSQLVISNLTLLKVLLWLVLLGLFVELEFGLPFFVLSLFYWLYQGLRSPALRQPGELSAYSVFNPDCQPLLGTLTAEQLEGEMGYRPLGNR